MYEKIEIEGKNLEEIINKLSNEFKLDRNDFIIINSEEKGSLFKGKKLIAQIIKKDDLKNYIRDFFKNLEKYMNVKINFEIKEENNNYNIMLVSDNNSILIGKEGKNLEAIQTIMRAIIKKLTNNNVSLNIDV